MKLWSLRWWLPFLFILTCFDNFIILSVKNANYAWYLRLQKNLVIWSLQKCSTYCSLWKIRKFSLTLFWQKVRESNVFAIYRSYKRDDFTKLFLSEREFLVFALTLHVFLKFLICNVTKMHYNYLSKVIFIFWINFLMINSSKRAVISFAWW